MYCHTHLTVTTEIRTGMSVINVLKFLFLTNSHTLFVFVAELLVSLRTLVNVCTGHGHIYCAGCDRSIGRVVTCRDQAKVQKFKIQRAEPSGMYALCKFSGRSRGSSEHSHDHIFTMCRRDFQDPPTPVTFSSIRDGRLTSPVCASSRDCSFTLSFSTNHLLRAVHGSGNGPAQEFERALEDEPSTSTNIYDDESVERACTRALQSSAKNVDVLTTHPDNDSISAVHDVSAVTTDTTNELNVEPQVSKFELFSLIVFVCFIHYL